MSLSAINTVTSPVTSYPGGTISIRCADYVGAARGSLAVVTDSDSISGQVVHESQSLAYSTSAGFGPPLPADYEFPDVDTAGATLSFPIADLPLNADITYTVFLHWKVTGAGSTGHRIGQNFMQLSVQDQILYGFNDTISSGAVGTLGVLLPIPATSPGYRLTWFQYIESGGDGFHGPGTPTDLIVVSAAGQDSTYETYLDALFLIPYQGDGDITHYIQFMGDPAIWEPLTDNQTGDPTTTSDPDDEEASNGLTTATQDAQFSVIPTDSTGFCTGFQACGSDYQRAEDEGSFTDMMQFLWDGAPTWPDDPQSWIAMTAGPKLIPAQTIETETFGTNVTPDENRETFASTSGDYYWEITNDGIGFSTVVVNSGVFSVANLFNATNISTSAYAELGNKTFPSDSPTHMNAKQTLLDMSNGIIEATSLIGLNTVNSTAYAVTGFIQSEWPNHNSSSFGPRTIAGVFVYEDGGDLKATLRADARVSGLCTAVNFGTSPVTVGTSGDTIRCKVERRYYVWRAKVWVDGGSEPGSWTLEGFLPNFYTNTNFTPSSIVASQYPYSDANRDEWGANCRSITDWYPIVGTTIDPDPAPTGVADMTFTGPTVTYDPDGSTMVPMHMQLKKYDGSVDYGTVQLDGDRVVIASLAQHTFDNDFHGFTTFLWSDGGAPALQPAVLSDIFIRAPLGVIFGSIKYP